MKRSLKDIHPKVSVPNFRQFGPLLRFPGCPKVLASFWQWTCPQAPKIKFFKKWKNTPDIHPRSKCAKLSQIRPILRSSGRPKVQASLWRKTRPQTPKISNFVKNEKTPQYIHPRKKCDKLQRNPTIFEVSRLPQYKVLRHTHRYTDIHNLRF